MLPCLDGRRPLAVRPVRGQDGNWSVEAGGTARPLLWEHPETMSFLCHWSFKYRLCEHGPSDLAQNPVIARIPCSLHVLQSQWSMLLYTI